MIYCIGGGMNLAACCDLRYCNEGARFGVPAARLGLGYGLLMLGFGFFSLTRPRLRICKGPFFLSHYFLASI